MTVCIVEGVEVTQTIQNLSNSVVLIARKPTLVRVYVSSNLPTTSIIRGEINVTHGAHSSMILSENAVAVAPAPKDANGNADIRELRADISKSLNFVLPAQMLEPGALTIRVGTCFINHHGRELMGGLWPDVTVTFKEAPPLLLRLVSVDHDGKMPGNSILPQPIDYQLIESWLKRAYPIADLDISRTKITRPWGFGANEINVELTALRNIDLMSGSDPLRHYIGLVSDGDGTFFLQGLASGAPQTPNPDTVATSPTGANKYPWDTDGSYGDWYVGHELAHTFGRAHIGSGCRNNSASDPAYPFKGGKIAAPDEDFVGLDVGDPTLNVPRRAYRGTAWHDVMSYCDYVWISHHTYEHLFQRLHAEKKMTFLPKNLLFAGVSATSTASPVLNIVGLVNFASGAGEIRYTIPMIGAVLGGNSERVSLRVLDARGEPVDTSKARLKFDLCTDFDGEIDKATERNGTAVIDSYVNWPSSAQTVELLIDNELVSRYTRDDDGRLEILKTVGSGRRPGPYIVQESNDGGRTWITLDVGSDDPYTPTVEEVDLEPLPSFRRRILRLTAEGVREI